MKKTYRKEKVNKQITNNKIRLTGEGFNGSLVSLAEGLKIANELELDLVLISESNDIGICKIMNYEKFIYDEGKKVKNKALDTKEIKFGPNTSDNDVEYRVKHITEFLQKGHRVKLSLQFRGREISHIDKGKELMLKVIVAVSDFGSAESMPNMEGKKMFVNLKPKSTK